MLKNFFIAFIVLLLSFSSVNAEKVDKINVSGNERISKDTIIIFGEIDLNDDFDDNVLNSILKNLYNTNFFQDIKIDINNKTLNINVVENPIIQKVQLLGIKAKKMKEPILEQIKLKKNNSYNEYLVKKDKELILNLLKTSGFYFAEVKSKMIDILKELQSIIPEVLQNYSWKKSMKWSNYDLNWARPLKSIVAMLDNKIIDFN